MRPRRQRGAAMHLAADAASDTAHNGGDRMCRRSDCLLVVFRTCYFAPNICSSLPSAEDVRDVLQLDVRARRERGGVSKKSPRSRQVRALVLGSRRQILLTP